MLSNISMIDCMRQDLLEYHYVNDAVNQIIQAEYGTHYLIVYPDLATLRKMYSKYVQEQIKDTRTNHFQR